MSITRTNPEGLTIVSVGDLEFSDNRREAYLTVDDTRYLVFETTLFLSVDALVKSVKDEGDEEDMNPWVQIPAYDAGIRVEF